MHNKFKIFRGLPRNWIFIFINTFMAGLQVMVIFVGGKAISVTRLNGSQWGISIVLGALSLPAAMLIRLVPDKFCAKLAPSWLTEALETMTSKLTEYIDPKTWMGWISQALFERKYKRDNDDYNASNLVSLEQIK